MGPAWLARIRLGAVTLAVIAGGCASPDEVRLSRWTLAVPDRAAAEVELPARLDLPDHRTTYRLRSVVELPEALRGHALSLVIARIEAPVTLRAAGHVVAPLEEGLTTSYRPPGLAVFRIPARLTGAPALELELTVEHTWAHSGWLGVAPTLAPTETGEAWARVVRAFNQTVALVGGAAVAQLGLMYFFFFLFDRRRRDYLYFGIQGVSAAFYPLLVVGLTAAWLGPIDLVLFGVLLTAAPIAGAYFTHAHLGLPPPSRGWLVLFAVAAASSLTALDPFVGPRWSGRVVPVVVAIAVVYNIVVLGRCAGKPEHRPAAPILFICWLVLGACTWMEVLAWLGVGELAGGLRLAGLGLLLFAVTQALLLSYQHIQSSRRSEDLNVALEERVRVAEERREENELLNQVLREQIEGRKRQRALAVRLAQLNEMALAMSRAGTVEQVYEVAVEHARRMIDVERASVSLLTEDPERLAIATTSGDASEREPIDLGASSAGTAMLEQRPVYVPDTSEVTVEHDRRLAGRGLRTLMSIPLLAGGEAFGTLDVAAREVDALDEEDRRILMQIATHLAENVESKRLAAGLERALAESRETLEQLKATQSELVRRERMAVLGRLVAGVAHEINTPLGAIGASVDNVRRTLGSDRERIETYRALDEVALERFGEVLEHASRTQLASAREERQMRRRLRTELEAAGFSEQAHSHADALTDIGVDDLELVLPLLRRDDGDRVLAALYALSRVRRNVSNIALAVAKASKIVFALKSYTRQAQPTDVEPIDVRETIDTVLTIYQNQLKAGVDVVRDYPDDVPRVRADAHELSQVWTNLVQNALHAMEQKGRLEIVVAHGAGEVCVSVIDDGPGIGDDVRDRIFEPFFTTKVAGEGTGLGLDIVARIVEKFGGRIDVDSRAGRTSFRVTLPAEDET